MNKIKVLAIFLTAESSFNLVAQKEEYKIPTSPSSTRRPVSQSKPSSAKRRQKSHQRMKVKEDALAVHKKPFAKRVMK